tara:strand:- start:466 stop:1248 length:783 start_codon:yes stop_codon:yes gene_type:complete
MRILIFLIFAISHPIFAQKTEVLPLDSISLKAEKFIGVDKYSNLYATSGAVLYKINAEKTLQFSDIQLGAITSVDIINPLRITLFYQDFNTAVILDNTLNEITRVDFNKLEEYRNVSFARTANDRQLWIFNIDLQQLELFNYRTNTVKTVSPPIKNSIVTAATNFNYCWVATPDFIFQYNSYGSLVSKFKNVGLNALIENNENLLGLSAEDLFYKRKNSENFTPLNIARNDVKQFYWTGEILYLYRRGNLTTYQLKLPKT